MPISTIPEGQQRALYAVGAAALLSLLFNIPYVALGLAPLRSHDQDISADWQRAPGSLAKTLGYANRREARLRNAEADIAP